MRVFRAAYWESDDGQDQVRLTGEEHADLDDEALRREAEAEAARVDFDLSGGEIRVGDWVE